jgi:hypothetical protein
MALCCLRIFTFLFSWSKDMPITLGDTSITGLGVGGLPSGTVNATTLAAGAARANFGAGAVLQVVSTTKVDTFSITSQDTFVDITGLTVSITPRDTSSRMVVIVHVGAFGNNAGTARTASFRLVRDSTAIGIGTPEGARVGASFRDFIDADANHARNGSFTHVDSPSTTSAITYKLQANNQGNTLFINRNGSNDNNGFAWGTRCASSITVMEIAG